MVATLNVIFIYSPQGQVCYSQRKLPITNAGKFTMKKSLIFALAMTSILLSGCDDKGVTPTRKACLGTNNDSLIESLKEKCKKGDIIATKNPAYFCDFKSSIAFNSYNSAMCIYTGQQADERIQDASTTK